MEVIKVFLVVRWPVGGIRTFINYVYSAWPNSGIELHILTPDVMEVGVLKEQLRNLSCQWYSTPSDKPSVKDFMFSAAHILRANSFDVIHAHGFTSALSVSPLLPFCKAASVFTSHDVLRKNQFSGIWGALKRYLIPIALNRFDVIHSVSRDADENLKQYFPLVNKRKCLVILNGVDTDRFFWARAANMRSAIGVSSSIKLIGFFGRFMPQKGFKYLVAAIAELNKEFPDRYRVVCFGSGAFIREEKLLLEQQGLTHLFIFHDFVADTAPYIKSCDMVVMPSLWEACPLVPMEVLSAGVPLVATTCIGLREVCEGSPAIMVESASADSLAKGIQQVNNEAKSDALGYAKVAKERFSIESVRLEIMQLYWSLCERRN